MHLQGSLGCPGTYINDAEHGDLVDDPTVFTNCVLDTYLGFQTASTLLSSHSKINQRGEVPYISYGSSFWEDVGSSVIETDTHRSEERDRQRREEAAAQLAEWEAGQNERKLQRRREARHQKAAAEAHLLGKESSPSSGRYGDRG